MSRLKRLLLQGTAHYLTLIIHHISSHHHYLITSLNLVFGCALVLCCVPNVPTPPTTLCGHVMCDVPPYLQLTALTVMA